MSGHSKWATTKHRKARAGREALGAVQQARRASSRSPPRPAGTPTPRTTRRWPRRSPRPRATRCPRTRSRPPSTRRSARALSGELRGGRLRGLRPRGRRALRRGAHGQPQPHRRRRPRGVHARGRQPRRDGLGRVPVRAPGEIVVESVGGSDEDEMLHAGRRSRRRGHRGRRRGGLVYTAPAT